jgi:rhamnogalacturonyl hydrolase YesR
MPFSLFMKKPSYLLRRIFLKMFFVALVVLSCGGRTYAADITDAEIRDVVNRVARHQLIALKDGDYPPLSAPNAMQTAQAATPPDGITWSYPWGVTLYGLLRSTDATGDKEVEKFVLDHNLICARYYTWLNALEESVGNSPDMAAFLKKNKLGTFMRLGSLDSCGAMGTQMLEGMLRHPDQASPDEKAVVSRIADWIVNKQDRLPDGTLWRSKSQGGTVWPDDLYMGGAFLVQWAKYTGDNKYLDDAAHQIINQAALTQDTDGLWFHGYFVSEKTPAPFKWGRGNGWVMVTTVEALSAMPENDPLRPQLLDILRRQVEGLKKVQAPDGMWRQILDKPELWDETSCTAMFTYGIARAVNRGWIDPSNMAVARNAFAAIAQHVNADGSVTGTCEGTNINTSLDFYAKRQQPVDDLHGRGPTMLAGTEILAGSQK